MAPLGPSLRNLEPEEQVLGFRKLGTPVEPIQGVSTRWDRVQREHLLTMPYPTVAKKLRRVHARYLLDSQADARASSIFGHGEGATALWQATTA